MAVQSTCTVYMRTRHCGALTAVGTVMMTSFWMPLSSASCMVCGTAQKVSLFVTCHEAPCGHTSSYKYLQAALSPALTDQCAVCTCAG